MFKPTDPRKKLQKEKPVDPKVWKEAFSTLTALMSNAALNANDFQYFLIGSGACLMHGVDFKGDNPADIDIAVSHPLLVREIFKNAKNVKFVEAPESSHLIGKFILHTSGGPITVDVPTDSEFGLSNAKTISKNGMPTLTLVETLKSLFLRTEHRPKDILAFNQLIKNNLTELKNSPDLKDDKLRDFRDAVYQYIRLYEDKELAAEPEMLKEMLENLDKQVFTHISLFQHR